MVGPATARAGGRHWHCSCDVGFAGIQNARVVGLQRFHPDFRGRLGGQSVCGRVGMPGGSPWEGNAQDGEWNPSCSTDPRKFEMTGTWTAHWRNSRQPAEPAQEVIWAAAGKATKVVLSKLFWHSPPISHALDAGYGPIGFNVFALLDFSLGLALSFFSKPVLLPFEMGMFSLCYCMLKIYNLCLVLQEFTAKILPWVSEKTLNMDFGEMLELLRLWGLLKLD
jgi:hypothetical protein